MVFDLFLSMTGGTTKGKILEIVGILEDLCGRILVGCRILMLFYMLLRRKAKDHHNIHKLMHSGLLWSLVNFRI